MDLKKNRRPKQIEETPKGTRNGFGNIKNCSYWERDYLKVIPRHKRIKD